MTIEIGTDYILESEPCYQLSELDLPSLKGPRRYRVFVVVRGDRLARYLQDMGPSKEFKTDEMRILGGVVDEFSGRIFIEHSVEELIQIIETLRAGKGFDKKELAGVDNIKN